MIEGVYTIPHAPPTTSTIAFASTVNVPSSPNITISLLTEHVIFSSTSILIEIGQLLILPFTSVTITDTATGLLSVHEIETGSNVIEAIPHSSVYGTFNISVVNIKSSLLDTGKVISP